MAPILDKVSQARDDIELVKLDADASENETMLREYDVRSIPTLVLLDPDGAFVGQVVGAMSEYNLQTWLDSKLGR